MKQFLKFLPILLLYLVAAGRGYARLQGQPLIDSLLKELPKQKEDTNKVYMLHNLSFAYYSTDPDEGIKYGRQSLELATRLNWKKGMAAADNCLGTNYFSKSDYPAALAYYNEALKVYEYLDYKKEMATELMNLGNVYEHQGDYPKGLEYDFKALKIDEEAGNKQGIAQVTGNIGANYDNRRDYPKALEYYFKALKMDEETGNKTGVAIVTGNIGGVYSDEGDYAKALEFDFKALKEFEETGDKDVVASLTGNIGDVYASQHNYTQALAWHFKAVQMSEETGDKSNEGSFLADIATEFISIAAHNGSLADTARMPAAAVWAAMPLRPDSLVPKGRTALLHRAETYINKAIAIFEEIGSLDQLQQSYNVLSTADSLLGDYKGAFYARGQFIIVKDSVFSKVNAVKIARLELQKKIETDSLKSEQARSVIELRYRQQRNYTYIGIAGIGLLLVFTFFIARNNKLLSKEKKRSEDLLLNILPEEVADQLKETGKSDAKHFDNVTVLFTDFVNFTQAGERMSPQALIDELHTCFKAFDDITTKYGVEKIKTIGDAYLAVAGLPTADPLHAEHIVRAAIEINAFMQDRLAKLGSSTFEIRIGIHSGSVVAGIVGVKKFAYDIWGDTVNTAARMEQNSEAGRINISATTYELVKDKFNCEYRGEIDAKGKGMLKMYYVSAEAFSA